MSPQEKKKQLTTSFKKKREKNKDNKLKTFSELNIDVDKKILKKWRNNR